MNDSTSFETEGSLAEEVSLDIQLKWRDYLSAQYLHLRPRKWMLYLGIVFVTLAVVVSIVSLSHALSSGQWTWSLFILPAVLVYFAVIYFVWMPIRIRKLFSQQKSLHMPMHVTLGEAGVRISGESSSGHFPWAHVWRWLENRHLFLLYQADNVFHMIPKRELSSSQESLLREYLKTRVGPPGRKRRDA